MTNRNLKKELAEHDINVVVRRNGIIFIEYNSKANWNGSRLATELSVNTFNDYWNALVKYCRNAKV
ncbi:hypothetical protein [Flavobacterium sp. U410]